MLQNAGGLFQHSRQWINSSVYLIWSLILLILQVFLIDFFAGYIWSTKFIILKALIKIFWTDDLTLFG
jgi:hypothetical protein